MSERFLQPFGQDRAIRDKFDAGVNDSKTKLGIVNPGALIASPNYEEPTIDLLPPIHPGGILLADEAALGETDPIQLGGIAFKPEKVAEFGSAFADAKAKAMLEPPVRGLGGTAKPALTELGQPWVGDAFFKSTDQCTASAASCSMPIERRSR